MLNRTRGTFPEPECAAAAAAAALLTPPTNICYQIPEQITNNKTDVCNLLFCYLFEQNEQILLFRSPNNKYLLFVKGELNK